MMPNRNARPLLLTGRMLKMLTAFFLCALWCPLLLPAQVADLYQQTSEVNNLMVQYDADMGNVSRFYFIRNSPERRERMQQVVNAYLQKMQAVNFERLPTGARVDYILFNRNLQETRRLLLEEAQRYGRAKAWVPFADTIYAMEQARRRGEVPDAPRVAARLNAIGRQLRQLQTSLAADTALPLETGKMAEGILYGLRDALKSVYDFYNGYDPLFTWWIPKTWQATDSLLQFYTRLFQERNKKNPAQKDDGSGIIGNPIGRTELIRQLQVEMIPYTPEELVSIANQEFAWCDREMLNASREMGFGDDWKAAMEKVKQSYVPPAEQPQTMLQLYQESVDFLKQHNLVTIPPMAEETWRMSMMTPERQLVNPFFLGGEEFILSYPTNTMTYEDKLMSMRGNNPHFSRATVHHELIAGHGLQQFMNSRYKTYRHFDTPFWIEGWALYWERLLWNLQFPRSPEDRIGMLFWRMHRCARILFSLNYHLGNWTPAQCIRFLVDRVGHEPANAEGEIRRSFTGGYGPLYQIAYMIGGLQFEALQKELVGSGKMTYKQYHDAVLKENSMPVEMVRAILINQPLKKDFTTSWRFYELPREQ